MKRFKKLSTTFLTTVLLACNTITSPGFNVWAQEEKIPIDNPSDVEKSIEEPVEETIVPEEPVSMSRVKIMKFQYHKPPQKNQLNKNNFLPLKSPSI